MRVAAIFGRCACIGLLAVLAGCGGHTNRHTQAVHRDYHPTRYYPPPGPEEDPWGPYIHEASGRFGVPEQWIRRVMRQESGGQEDVISWAGAMGLMQVMPDTYSDLQARYGLGDDPFDPHNNILAGTAYIREMYDRFGSPGFLAAYNAGPNRMEKYLTSGTPLPDETVHYVASIAPYLGSGLPSSGPLAVYAAVPATVQPAVLLARPTSAGCDLDAAYDPSRPCAPVPEPNREVQVASLPYVPAQPRSEYRPAPVYPPAPAYQPAFAQAPPAAPPVLAFNPPVSRSVPPPTPYTPAMVPIRAPAPLPRPAPDPARWAVQVGTYANLSVAQAAAEHARQSLPDLLATAKTELPPTAPFGAQVAFRARLSGLTAPAATDACARLSARGQACITIPPAGT